ncbi:DNA polymerase III subunit beta [Corynebacterium choanae]|uniref:Beta sliding clamp n=1 Tax=Corynebacterium choanae TaxID=1862358 RepID=A0A3G6J348_9CORY|nr:DNA polymerase III subunit beta [Corynebacterium choanae]AZA12437.1 DNA polymerase III subunit beta [Corynebacterium choanae]
MDVDQIAFEVANSELAQAVSWVARKLPSNPAQPVLKGIRIVAEDDVLEISGYDYEVSNLVRIPADVESPGKIALAGKLLSDITSNLPKETVKFDCDGSLITVDCGSAHFELPAIPIDDYPALPVLPEPTGSVDPQGFAWAIQQVAVAASNDDALPMLTGIYIAITGDEMLLATTDRFRMAVRKLSWNALDKTLDTQLLVPAKTLLDSSKTLSSASSEDVVLAVSDAEQGHRLLGLQSGDRKTSTRLIDAEYPNFRPLLPERHTATATVAIDQLLQAVKRVSLVADSAGQIRLQFTDGELIISAGGADAGKAQESIPCAFFGDTIVTAFRTQYLREGLQVMASDRVFFGFTEPHRPVLLAPQPEELPEQTEDGFFPAPQTDFQYVLMPVRTS